MKETGNIMKENLLINEFFQKLTEERSGKSIAANSNYTKFDDVMLRLARKYNVTAKYAGQARTVYTPGHIWLYKVNDQLYGLGFSSYYSPDPNPEYDKTDWLKLKYKGEHNTLFNRHIDPDERSCYDLYEILGKVTADDVDENVWNFLQDFGWYRESEESKTYQGKVSPYNKKHSDADKEEYKRAKAVINVEILESELPQPEDFADDFYENYDEDGWTDTTSREDIDAELKVKVLLGHIPLYTGIIYPDLSYEARTSYIECTGTAEEINSIWDNDGNETSLVELADKVPEGRFRDLYIKYISKIITEAVGTYAKKNSVGYKIDWTAFEPDY